MLNIELKDGITEIQEVLSKLSVYDLLVKLRETHKDRSILGLKVKDSEDDEPLNQFISLNKVHDQFTRKNKKVDKKEEDIETKTSDNTCLGGGATKEDGSISIGSGIINLLVVYDDDREDFIDSIDEDMDEGDLDDQFTGDKEIIMTLIEKNPRCYRDISDDMREDIDVAMIAAKNGYWPYSDREYGSYKKSPEQIYKERYAFPEKIRNNKQLNMVYLALDNSPSLYFASEDIKNDPEMVLHAIKHCVYALQYASDELMYNVEFLYKALQINWRNYIYIPHTILNDTSPECRTLARFVNESKKKYYEELTYEGSEHTSDEDEDI